jgi:hypothetical protein
MEFEWNPEKAALNFHRAYAKKPGFYGKFIILANGLDEETGFLGSSCVSPVSETWCFVFRGCNGV